MHIKITLTCDCGNVKEYEAENKYHTYAHETFVDLTDVIYDDYFNAKPTPDGMWVQCKKCSKGYAVV